MEAIISFQYFTGQRAPGTTSVGGYENRSTPGLLAADLFDTEDNSTGWELYLESATGGTFSNSGGQQPEAEGKAAWALVAQDVWEEYWRQYTDDVDVFRLAGLAPDKLYTLELFCGHAGNYGRQFALEVGEQTDYVNGYYNQYNTAKLGDLTPDTGGTLDFTIRSLSGGGAYNSIRVIEQAPDASAEPPPSAQASKVSGIVQIDGTPAQRTVRAFGYNPTVHQIDGETINLSKSLGHATSDPDTGEYTIDLLAGYDKRIFVVAFDDYGADFAPDLAVAVGDRIHPTTPNGHVFECTSAGTLPSVEPTWVVDTEAAQLYGTASMIAKPFYRPMVHGPVIPEVIEPAPEP